VFSVCDLSEDPRASIASPRSEGNDAYDVISAAAIGADEGTTRVTHAGRPLPGLAKAHHASRESAPPVGVVIPDIMESLGGPDLAGDLLKLISQSLWITFDQTPSREDAVFVSAVIFAGHGQAGGSSIRAAEINGGIKLKDGDVVGKLLWGIISGVDLNVFHGQVLLGPIAGFQFPFTDSDFVVARVFALGEFLDQADNVKK
jgi:hypothetical protein